MAFHSGPNTPLRLVPSNNHSKTYLGSASGFSRSVYALCPYLRSLYELLLRGHRKEGLSARLGDHLLG